jgi:hypothetical protein
MTLILSGTDGLSDVDGSAATPAIRGTDANTGIFFPAADTIAFAEGGVESMRLNSAGNVGIGTTNPTFKLAVSGSDSTYIGVSSSGGGTGSGLYTSNSTNAYYIGAGAASGGTGLEFRDTTNASTRMVLNSNGTFQIISTLGVGNATPSTSGAGITFPASQSASSNANTLDDYEEGTFTPNLVNNGGTSTWSVKIGRYVKIGATVNFWCYFDAGGPGSGGALILSNLPFVGSGSASSMSTVGTIQVNSVQNWYPAFQNASTSDAVIYTGGSQVINPSINFAVVQGCYNVF